MYVVPHFTRSVRCNGKHRSTLSGCAMPHSAAVRGFKRPLVTRHVRRASAFTVSASSDSVLSEEVVAVIPATLDLDCLLSSDKSFLGVLDTAKLLEAGNSLSKLWSKCEALSSARLSSLPLAARQPGSPLFRNNHLAIQGRILCEQLDARYSPLQSSGQPLDFYVMSCVCIKESRQHSQDKHDWANRCITLATLGIQILHHPGTALQATLPPPTHAIPMLDLGIPSSFASLTSYAVSVSSQAEAASWAAFCSQALQRHDMEPKFLIIQVFFMRQHGLGHASDPAWKLRFPPALPGLTALHSAQFRLLDMQATSKHPKPGGWSVKEWTLLHRGLNCGVEGPFSGCERAFVEMWARVGLEHATWCENSVQPVLARSLECYIKAQEVGTGLANVESPFPKLSQAWNHKLVIPDAFFPDLDQALSCGWLDATLPGIHTPESYMVGHDVWARLSEYYRQQNRRADADAILLRGLVAGCPETASYNATSFFKSHGQSMMGAPSKAHNLTLALMLLACNRRAEIVSKDVSDLNPGVITVFASMVAWVSPQWNPFFWAILDIFCKDTHSAGFASKTFVTQLVNSALPAWHLLWYLSKMEQQGFIVGRGAWQAALLELVGLGKGHTYTHMVCQLSAICPHHDVWEDFLLHHVQLHGSNFGLTALVGVKLSLKGRKLPAKPALKILLHMQSAPGLRNHLEKVALSAATCSQLLQHSTELLQDALKVTCPPRPSALRLSVPDGTTPPDVALAAAEVLAAHSEIPTQDVSQSSPALQQALQTVPAQPDSAQPESAQPESAQPESAQLLPEVLSSSQQSDDAPTGFEQVMVDAMLGNLATLKSKWESRQSKPSQPNPRQPPTSGPGHGPGAAKALLRQGARLMGSIEAFKADLASKSEAADPCVPVSEVLWQIFDYAEHAGLTLTAPALKNIWTSQAVPGFQDRLVDMYLSRKLSKSSLRLSLIAAHKLQLIMLSRGMWAHAAELALLVAQFTAAEAQAGMNAALLGARQTQSANETMQSVTPPSQEANDAGLLVDQPAENSSLLQPPTASSNIPDDKAQGNAGIQISSEAQVQADTQFDAKAQALRAGNVPDLVTSLQEALPGVHNGVLIVLRALDFTLPAEAAIAAQLFQTCKAPSQQLQQAFFEKLCLEAPAPTALHQLQAHHQLAAQSSQHYELLVQRLSPDGREVMQILSKDLPSSSAVLSGLIAACKTSQLQPSLAHLLAWHLWEHAVAKGLTLSPAAQEVLWQTQSGDRLLKLHAHLQPNSSPALTLPPPDVLSAVVEAGIGKQDWSAAVEAALGLVEAMQPLRAAEFIAQAVDRMNRSGSSVHVAAKGMPVLHQAECHADVVKLFGLLEAEGGHSLASGELCLAVLSWLVMHEVQAAHAAWQRHSKLLSHVTAAQQQQIFQAALKVLQGQPDAAAVAMARDCCLLAAKLKMPRGPEQVLQLVDMLLAGHQNYQACMVVKQAGEYTIPPPASVAAALHVALKRDIKQQEAGLSAMTSDLLALWQQCCRATGARQLTAEAASMLAVLLTRDERWSDVADIFQSRMDKQQAMTEQLWDSATFAYEALQDQEALFKAWAWMRDQGHDWLPSRPSCHVSLLLAITELHDQPSQGTKMLVAHHGHYGVMPSLHNCKKVIRLCNQRIADNNISTDCQEAIWTLLRQMQSPALPKPTVNTFVLAMESVLTAHDGFDSVPLHHALVLLQQNVWSRMHHVLGSGGETLSAYAPYLTRLTDSLDVAAETVQTVLLMAQNGLDGVSSAACVALAFNLIDLADFDDEQTQWMQDTFGAEFVHTVQAVADQATLSDVNTKKLASIAVRFPKQHLPKVSEVELNDGTAVFALQLGCTPFWLWSSAARQDPTFVREVQSRETQVQDSDNQPDTVPDAAQPSAAEQLVSQYGHVGKGNKKKRR